MSAATDVMSTATDVVPDATQRQQQARAASSSDESEEEGWEERGWAALVDKVSFKANEYNRAKLPYRKHAPQIPFFMHLAGVTSRRLRVWIPQTVVLGMGPDPGSNGLQQTWLYNDEDGCVQRRDEFDPSKDVFEAFRSPSNDPQELVAIFKRKRAGAPTDTMLLNSDELKEILYNRQSYGLFCVQKFVRLRKGRSFLARSVWTKEPGGGGFSHFAYYVSNVKNYQETGNPEDLLIDLTAFKSSTINVLRGSSVEDLKELTNEVATYIQRACAVDVQQVVVDFTKGNSGRWIMLQVKDFKLKRSKGLAANHQIKERLKKDSGEPDFAASFVKYEIPKGRQTTLHKKSAKKPSAALNVEWAGGEAGAKEFRRLMEAGFYDEARARLGEPEGQLVRKPDRYKQAAPPLAPGEKVTIFDTEAVDACKWCCKRCRSSHLQCTMSLSMIRDVQSHMRKRGVVLSWFDRTDVTLRTADSATLSGTTSTLMSGQRVCHNCYEIYVTELKLMRAEKLFMVGQRRLMLTCP